MKGSIIVSGSGLSNIVDNSYPVLIPNDSNLLGWYKYDNNFNDSGIYSNHLMH
jgi:hypothetical protein